jgi:hypothetical protein
MTNLREKLLQIVRKTLRDGYLSEELDDLIEEIVKEVLNRGNISL